MLVCLCLRHVACLKLAVLTGRDVELHRSTFVKRLEAVHLDLREMHEEVFAILLRDDMLTIRYAATKKLGILFFARILPIR